MYVLKLLLLLTAHKRSTKENDLGKSKIVYYHFCFRKKKNDSSFDINVSLEDIKARKYVYELYSVKHTYNEHAYNELLLSHIYSPM